MYSFIIMGAICSYSVFINLFSFHLKDILWSQNTDSQFYFWLLLYFHNMGREQSMWSQTNTHYLLYTYIKYSKYIFKFQNWGACCHVVNNVDVFLRSEDGFLWMHFPSVSRVGGG